MSVCKFYSLLIAGLMTLLTSACGEEATVTSSLDGPMKSRLDWDLRADHTTRTAAWASASSALILEGGVQVRLVLPTGRIFNDRVERIVGYREGDVIRSLDLYWRPTTVEDAYEKAKQLAEEWSIDLRNIDAWYERRVEQHRQGREEYLDTAFTGSPHSKPLDVDGPVPAIELLYSFNHQRPVLVNLNFHWPR